jgi:hypothetical protein
MALPVVKIAISNGHFQESLQNYGDRGTWDAEEDVSGNTKLTDRKANWVTNEWADYSCVVDTNGTNNVCTIISNTVNTITVSGDQRSLVTPGTTTYRIAGGLTGTVTANASSSDTITVSAVKNKWEESKTLLSDELIGMKFVPDRLDGTAYTIIDNSATTIKIDTSIVVTATTFEVGRGASTTAYPESLNISAELNEPKQASATIVNDVVGTNKFEQEKDIDNPLMLGSLVRVTESTGGKILFEGHIQDAPTAIDADNRTVSFVAYDRLAILDYTVVPGEKIAASGELPNYSFHKKTPMIESDATGYQGDNRAYQTKAFEDYSFVSQPVAYSGSVNLDGTYTTATSGGSTANYVLEPDSGTPFNTDLIKPGCVVINCTTMKITHIKSIDAAGDTITCTDDIWTSGNKYVILSKNWQGGAGVESDSDYTATEGWDIRGRTREILAEPTSSTSGNDVKGEELDESRVYVGEYDGSSATNDTHMGFSGRAWVLLVEQTHIEFVHYNGYTYDFDKEKYFLNAYNTTPRTERNTRGDLTNKWKTTDTSNYKGVEWGAGSYIFEVYPNRLGGDAPKCYISNDGPIEEIGVVAAEGVIKLNDGDAKWDGYENVYVHQFSYDGDASTSPDKGTEDNSVDITDVVQVAVTGLTDTSASLENILSESKMTGGAGLQFNTSDSSNTGIKINTFTYEAFSKSGEVPINPKPLINKLCEDSGLLYDLRYDDNTNKVIFKPLIQQSSADITLAAGAVTSLTRERDLSDVYTAQLMQVQMPEQNYFSPKDILQYGCNFAAAGVPTNNARQSGFDSNGYASGTDIPEYFYDVCHLRGLGPDVENWDSATEPVYGSGISTAVFYQSLWKKCEWKKTSTSAFRNQRINMSGKYGIPTLSDDGNKTPFHLMTFWFRGGMALDIDQLSFKIGLASDNVRMQGIRRGGTYRVEVSTDIDVTDPFHSDTTWQRFNDNSLAMKTERGTKFTLKKCDVNSVKGIRILALASPYAQPGWWGEGREHLRQTNVDMGYQTWGYGSTCETFTEADPVQTAGSGRPRWNGNRQDAWGWSRDSWDDWKRHQNWYYGTPYVKTAFQNAIDNTICSQSGTTTPAGSSDERAGYVQTGNFLWDWNVRGVGKKALFIRTTKNQSLKDNIERLPFSPSYKKTANMGYKINAINLENFSFGEAQGLGQQFLDDKLRRFQARDYSLAGLSPFVNSNNIPFIGQTITVTDDKVGTSNPGTTPFSGVLTSYEFTVDAEGARFDFRLEDYDRYNTAQYIQAGDED